MKKTLAAFLLALTLLTGGAAAFSDVDQGLYYAAPIAWAVERGITTGTSEDTFSPDALCTQGQILTFLWRAAGSPQAEVEVLESASLNLDFARAIGWAIQRGILTGGGALLDGAILFDPSAPCTRGAAMNFLWRYAGSPAASAPGVFTDVAPGAEYAQAVAWAVEQGITSGTSETTFSPDEPCTRGQIATFLYRCLNEAGEKTPLPEDPEPREAAPQETARPLRTYTGTGRAYSLGLDGSEFTSEGVYEAEVTVDIYSPYEAVFTGIGASQTAALKELPEFARVGEYYLLGEEESRQGYHGSYVYCDSDMMDIARSQMELVKGRLPELANEIAVSEHFLSAYGFGAELGETVCRTPDPQFLLEPL